jgi:hypothetical protein
VSSNRIHNTSGAAIRATDEVERLIYRLNESINVINAADRTVNDLIDQLDEVFLEGVFGDGSTRITVPSVTGTPGQQIILDVYAYPHNTQTVETHLHLGEHRFTYDANGRHELNAVLDGSAPPGWLLTFTLTDPSLGTSRFSPPVTRDALADTDRDGMPDFWEQMFPDCLDPNDPDDAQEDCDQDGRTNLEEFVAYTHPGESDLPQQELTVDPGNVTLSTRGKSGRNYCLMRSSGLGVDDWEEVDRQFLVYSGEVTLTDPAPLADEGYYRIEIQLP